jgi:hypothetical protein
MNEVAHVPDESFILQAKRAGLKLTFGTDARNQNAAHFYYCYQMAEKCRLTEADMFVPTRTRPVGQPGPSRGVIPALSPSGE